MIYVLKSIIKNINRRAYKIFTIVLIFLQSYTKLFVCFYTVNFNLIKTLKTNTFANRQ